MGRRMISIILKLLAVIIIFLTATITIVGLSRSIGEGIDRYQYLISVEHFCNYQGYPRSNELDDSHVLCYGDWGSEIFEVEVIE